RDKVLFVLGCTGIGKSELAIQIAERLRLKKISAEIINLDAMQIFKGLNIGTNKPTNQDIQRVKHHMFGVIDEMDVKYSVRDYVHDTRELISKMNQDSKIPIVVGGTNYYAAALAFEDYLQSNDPETEPNKDENNEGQSDYTYERLCQVDPISANKIHPNNTRKIESILKAFDKYGKKSDIQTQPKHTLRFDSKFIYLSPDDRSKLYQRIDERVNKMLERGLVQENIDFDAKFNVLNDTDINNKVQHGILQCIGFKEFIPLLKCVRDGRDPESVITQCTIALQTATRNYARKQDSWLRNKWAGHGSPLINDSLLYELVVPCASEYSSKEEREVAEFEWKTNVVDVGVDVALSLVDPNVDMKRLEEFVVREVKSSDAKTKEWKKFVCEICDGRVVNGPHEWDVHLRSQGHRVATRRKNRLKFLESTKPKQ
ncbi:tRNA dimethylallyltransferase, partial [Acrasis kona]